jgi:hypothetical protein
MVTNDKPRRINLYVANWQVDLKGKKHQVQVVAKLYRLGNHHLRY